MALTRVTPKKIAANRANAQKSTGPRTPEGKARTARNACKHHLYARTHTIPAEWQQRLIAQAVEATAEFAADQRLRDLHARYLYLELWGNEVDSLGEAYRRHAIHLAHGDFRRGAYNWHVKTPLARAFQKRRMHISARIFRASRDIDAYQRRAASTCARPRTFAAAAGAAHTSPSAEPTHIIYITSHFSNTPITCNQPSPPSPTPLRPMPASPSSTAV